MEGITVIIVNYRTLGLTKRCLESLLGVYPQVQVLLVDNGSGDESSSYVAEVAGQSTNISCLLNESNRFHGPALDQAIRRCRTPLALTIDSDCEVRRGGFIEQMAARFEQSPNMYAVGKVVHMDPFGYEAQRDGPFHFLYVRPCCLLLDRSKYLNLRPFIHHGSPGIHNMQQAQRRGYKLADFPIYEYIQHDGRGTCGRYGYGLGLRHTVENVLHKILSRYW